MEHGVVSKTAPMIEICSTLIYPPRMKTGSSLSLLHLVPWVRYSKILRLHVLQDVRVAVLELGDSRRKRRRRNLHEGSHVEFLLTNYRTWSLLFFSAELQCRRRKVYKLSGSMFDHDYCLIFEPYSHHSSWYMHPVSHLCNGPAY